MIELTEMKKNAISQAHKLLRSEIEKLENSLGEGGVAIPGWERKAIDAEIELFTQTADALKHEFSDVMEDFWWR